MYRHLLPTLWPGAFVLAGALAAPAQATSTLVTFNVLNATATLSAPFLAGDLLRLDTYVGQSQTGALLQTINFTVGAGVTGFTGEAAWEVSTATGTGPRLIGVNIDLFDAGNVLVGSDSFAGTLAGFALSTLTGTLTPGAYRLVATGTGVRDSSLDISLQFVGAVPEAPTVALMFAGLGVLGFVALRRR